VEAPWAQTAQDQIIQTEKKALEMASGVAHDFNNVLAVIWAISNSFLSTRSSQPEDSGAKTIELPGMGAERFVDPEFTGSRNKVFSCLDQSWFRSG
jgi:hypothetical protein